MLRRIPPVLPVCALIGAVPEPRRGKQENVARRSLAASRTVVLAEGLGGMRSDFHQVRLPVPNVVTDGRRFGPLSGGVWRTSAGVPSASLLQLPERRAFK